MSKQANPTVIGAFVVGAIVLLVVATVLFGGTALFATKTRYVTYFEGSVKGLRVGSNVAFRGVRIGYVTEIRIQAVIDTLETVIPVTIEILPGAFDVLDAGRIVEGAEFADRVRLEQLIEAGLRAELDVESFVTGQLLVQLDFMPDQPAIMRGINPPYPEIPTVPNDIEKAIGNIERLLTVVEEKVDVNRVLADAQRVLSGIADLANSSDLRDGLAGLNELANSPDLRAGIAGFRAFVTSPELRDTVRGIDEFVNSPTLRELVVTLGDAATDLRSTLRATDSLVTNADRELADAADRFGVVLGELDASLRRTGAILETLQGKLDDDTGLVYQAHATLRELEGAARSLRVLVDYLERDPSALIRGKQAPPR